MVLPDDPEQFAIISSAAHYLYAGEGQTVHVNGNPIPNADPATFQILRGAYARDDRRVFHFADRIVDPDLASFRPLDGPYASDYGHVYWMGTTIDGASPNAFRILNADFECSADDKYGYYRRSIIANADPRTLRPNQPSPTAQRHRYRSRNSSYGSHFHDWATCPKDGTQPYPHVRSVLLGTVPNAAL